MGSIFRINTNLSAMFAQRQLRGANQNLSEAQQRLSSGLRINTAADDAAGLAISQKQSAQIRGLSQAQENSQNGISMIQTAEGALGETQNTVQRMRELAVQAANDSLTSSDRSQIQEEIAELQSELDRIAETTEFNTKNLLDGSLSGKGNQPLEITANSGLSEDEIDNLAVNDNVTESAVGDFTIEKSVAATKGQQTTVSSANATLSSTTAVQGTTQVEVQLVDTAGSQVSGLESVQFNFNSGDTINDVVSALNNESGDTGVTASYDSGTAALTFETNEAGSGRRIKFTNAGGDFLNDGNLEIDSTLTNGTKTFTATDGTDAAVKIKDSQGSTVVDTGGGNITADGNDISITQGQLRGVSFSVGSDTNLETGDGFSITGGGGTTTEVRALNDLTSDEVADLSPTENTSSGTFTFEKRIRATKAEATTADSDGPVGSSTNLVASTKVTITTVDSAGNTVSGLTEDVEFNFNSSDTISDAVTAFNNRSGETGVTVSYDSGTGSMTFESNQAGSGRQIKFEEVTGDFANDGTLEIDSTLTNSTKTFTSTDGTDAAVKITDESGATVADTAGGSYTASGNAIQFDSGTLNGLSFDVGVDTSVEAGDQFEVFKRTTEELQFQTGANSGQTINLTIGDMRADALGFSEGDDNFSSSEANNMEQIDVSTQAGAQRAMDVADAALNTISTERAELGAIQNRLETTVSALGVQEENLQASRSRIRDADIAQEAVKQTRANILVQASTSVLAQANQSPQLALQLLG